jgi:fatty acid synthase subunit beta
MAKDEPVKDLLGNINKALIQRLLERKYGDKSTVPTITHLAVERQTVPKSLPSVTRTEAGNSVTFKFGSQLPETQLARCFGFFSYRCSRDKFICRQSFTPYSRTSG